MNFKLTFTLLLLLPSTALLAQLDTLGSLPKIRIGEVAYFIAPDDSYEKPGMVYMFPQIEVLYPDPENRYWVKPIFRVTMEVPGHDSFEATGWNDCSGQTTCRDCRGPCKPDPIPLAWIKDSNGLVKISFERKISGYFNGQEVPLQFESDSLSFWYDILNDRRVVR